MNMRFLALAVMAGASTSVQALESLIRLEIVLK